MTKQTDFEKAKSEFMSIFWGRSIDKKEDILYAVELSFRDMQVRTIKGFSEVEDEAKVALREWLSTQIENYFKGDAPLSEKDFDIFHKKLCKTIVEWFKGNLDQGKKATFTYGKAQKLVNMTFKNMYCYEAVADKIAHFRFCHIPIDSYIIDAFKKRNIEGPKDEDKDTRDVVWSKMNLKAYDDYTNRLRASVKEQYGEDMFPLQAEFIIWSEQKEAKAKEEHVKWEKNHRDKVNAKIDEIKKLSVKEDECY